MLRAATRLNRPLISSLLALAVAASLAACGDAHKKAAAAKGPPPVAAPDVHSALRGSVMQLAGLVSVQPQEVSGFGIVADLPNTGSGEMPPRVREILVEQLYREKIGLATAGTQDIHPEEILTSSQISAVEVKGFIPPLSPAGTLFDVTVTALPGTQTTSIENGLLWTTPLTVQGANADADPLSRELARGRGPVLLDPFAKTSDPVAAQKNARTGHVLSGGKSMQDMPVSIQLYAPSYRATAQIQRIVNGRFPNRPPFASALSDTVVTFTVPASYHNRPRDFVNVIMHMFLSQDRPDFTETKATELIEALKDPKSPHDDLSYALEGLGRTVIPQLDLAYGSDDPLVRYYTARAGAALGDVQAVVILQNFALDDKSPFQLDAVNTIASHGESIRSTNVLLSLLSSPNPRLRLAAYEGLVSMQLTPDGLNTERAPALNTVSVGRKFLLDRIVCDGPSIIYASTTGMPRIALIGKKFELPPGLLWISKDDLLTVSVPETPEKTEAIPAPTPILGSSNPLPAAPAPLADEKQSVLLYYRGPTGKQQITLHSPPALANVIYTLGDLPDPRRAGSDTKAPFISASYQRIIELLSQLCKDQSIDATFMLQRPTPEDTIAGAIDPSLHPLGIPIPSDPTKRDNKDLQLPDIQPLEQNTEKQ